VSVVVVPLILPRKPSEKMQAVKILVVDDSPVELHLYGDVLAAAGYTQLFAENGEQALTVLNSESSIVLVLLDVVMPGLNGLAVLKEIRRKKCDVAVIMHTSKNDFEYAQLALRHGTDDYLVKPARSEETLETLRRLIEPILKRKGSAAKQHRVFLSYAREDAPTVKRIVEKLRRNHLSPWLDTTDIVAGEEWMSAIENAISLSVVFIACLSQNSVGKRGIVQRELQLALDARSRLLTQDIYLIQLRLDNCIVPQQLSTIQWIDDFEKDGWKSLLQSIRVGIARRE